MSHLVSRIMLAIFMIPLGGVAYMVGIVSANSFMRSYSYGYSPSRDSVMFACAGGMAWAFCGAVLVPALAQFGDLDHSPHSANMGRRRGAVRDWHICQLAGFHQ